MKAFFGLLFVVTCLIGCTSQQENTREPSYDKRLSGGASTVFDESRTAYGHPSPTLTNDDKNKFFVGQSFFDNSWVIAPSSTTARDGLGPYFNARSCVVCHLRDGRGAPPESGEPFNSLLLRLSIPGQSDTGGVKPEPNYGTQLQGSGIYGVTKEGVPSVYYEEIHGTFPDGEPYTLLDPTYTISELGYGQLSDSTLISPRVAQSMVGMGLLDDINESDILALEDPDDNNQDGISGRVNYVWNTEEQISMVGRFGWKANQPTIKQQTQGAFLGDIGITTTAFPDQNMTDTQLTHYPDLHDGGNPEISDNLLDMVVVYVKNLGVPARRNVTNPTVIAGESLFHTIQCASCHQPTMMSRGDTIQPFTDLLLHDMGPGLADNRPDFQASGSEWRTAPLWGLGLIESVNEHTRLLHDGRARSIKEAILWHGGEAEGSKDLFMNLTAQDRSTLITFLESL